MSAAEPAPRDFRVLYASPLVTVRDYVCRECGRGAGAEECSDQDSIVLLRRGAFTRHFGRRRSTADTNHAAMFTAGSVYSCSHPADDGDRGTVLTTTPRLLRDLVREFDADVDEHTERPFPGAEAPCDRATFWRHRELVQGLTDEHAAEPLWADTAALQLIADVLTAAFARHAGDARRAATATELDHHERVEAAKTFLAGALDRRVTLDEVARSAHCSPFHFARMFQRNTGMPVHRYHLHLRLRAALERIAGTTEDLTRIALDLGFHSHSHFTDRFREAFGCAPSRARGASARRRQQMRKNLEV